MGDVEVVKLLIELVYRGKLTLRKPRRADSGLGLAAYDYAVGVEPRLFKNFLGLRFCVLYNIVGPLLCAHDKLGDPGLGKADVVYLLPQLVIFLDKPGKGRPDLLHLRIDLVGVIILLLCDIKADSVKKLHRHCHVLPSEICT